MSLYTFAAARLTTEDDRKRRPAIDRGQIARTLTLAGLFIIGLMFMAHQSDAADDRFQNDVGSVYSQADVTHLGIRGEAARRVAGR